MARGLFAHGLEGEKMKQPLVTIIVPVYNVADYLEDSLKSLAEQTYQNLDIIIIDDGSTDGGDKIVDNFAKGRKNVRVIHQENRGLSAARNRGLEIAKGDFITFLDSDDFFAKDAIESLVDAAQENKVDISACVHYERKEDGELIDFNHGELESGVYTVEEMLHNMLNERGTNLQVIGKLYRSEFFEKVRFPVGEVYEDVAVCHQLFLQCETKIAFIADPKYYYNLRTNSITNCAYNPKKNVLIKHTDEMCDAIDARYPSLLNATQLRRAHARFSILRMVSQVKKPSSKEKVLLSGLRAYLLKHANWIMKNPEAGRRDKLALTCLIFGNRFFAFAWRQYEKRKK